MGIEVSKRASVIIVNWNGLAYLQQCCAALALQSFTDYEVVLVDNGSTDGSVAWVSEAYPHVRVVANRTNLGFAEANNIGIRESSGEYVVVLNNDAYPEPQWLEALITVAEWEPGVGMVASQVRLLAAPETMDSAGIEVDTLGMAWNRHYGLPAEEEPAQPLEVFGPSGSAAFYRRSMLAEIGLFDARYFAYYEDVDLAWRARRAGWRCLYAPNARVHHVHSATGGKLSGFKAYYLGLNKWRTLFKHYPFGQMAAWLPLLLLVDGMGWGRETLLSRNTAALRGRLQAWRERGEFWRERRHLANEVDTKPWLVRPSLRRLGSQAGSQIGLASRKA
jgi:GT2 family glycosyltransferase